MGSYLFYIFVAPLQLIVSTTYEQLFRLLGSYGGSIIALSLTIYLLTYPIHKYISQKESESSKIKKRIEGKIQELCGAFSGYERHMMLRTLYRQNNYSTWHQLSSMLGLMVQIPIFVAVYAALGKYSYVEDSSFGLIGSLAKPDGVLLGVNLLPILMTGLGLGATYYYNRANNARQNYSSYGVVIIFLVLLYNVAAGAVLYWVTSNAIYLCVNYLRFRRGAAGSEAGGDASQQSRDAKPSGIGISALSFLAFAAYIAVAVPLLMICGEDNLDILGSMKYLIATVIGAVIYALGLLLFALAKIRSPNIHFATSKLSISFLLFLLFYGVIGRIHSGVFDNFVFSDPKSLSYGMGDLVLSFVVMVLAIYSARVLVERHYGRLSNVLVIFISVCLVSVLWSWSNFSAKAIASGVESKAAIFKYSKTDKNIVVLFTDGAIGGFIPDIVADPALRNSLTGFTWYKNSVSVANRTIGGVPPIFGGYDYSPDAINSRSGKLFDKINNAYAIFADNFGAKGYQVVYSDPFWYGYRWYGDCSLLMTKVNVRCINLLQRYHFMHDEGEVDQPLGIKDAVSAYLQYFLIGLFNSTPNFVRSWLYDGGEWNGLSYGFTLKDKKYLNNYRSIASLGEISDTTATKPTFTFISNELTRVDLMSGAGCTPERSLLPSSDELARYKTKETVSLFQTTRCLMRGVSQYLDWFRAQGIYDNTMFVIVSDHGWTSHNPLLSNDEKVLVHSMFQNLVMVKEIGDKDAFRTSKDLITNASVPGLVCGVIGGCTDSATGHYINKERMGRIRAYVTPWQPQAQTEDSFIIERTFEIAGEIDNPSSWREISHE